MNLTTICSRCGKELKENNNNYCSCDKCKRFTPKGSNNIKNKFKRRLK